jgi:hypothetical protein
MFASGGCWEEGDFTAGNWNLRLCSLLLGCSDPMRRGNADHLVRFFFLGGFMLEMCIACYWREFDEALRDEK